jgi:pyruvate dehydrogenase E2 component (dihydrolipoamide acetyltransferase)
MATKISMPKLSDTMEEGIILKWVKKEGEKVKQGEVIAEVQTDKADMELEAYDSGVMRKIFVPEGKGAAVGTLIAIIGNETEDISSLLVPDPVPVSAHTPAAVPSDNNVPTQLAISPAAAVSDSRIKASPLAKVIAKEHKIELTSIPGSGPSGRIIKKDVERALASGSVPTFTAAVRGAKEIPLSLMRKTIAKRLTESKSSIPHFYLTAEVDMKRAIEFRTSVNAAAGTKISYNDLIVKAVALSLRNNPSANASFAGDKIIQHGRIDIGIAVAIDEGLMTPVIRNADQKGLGLISEESKALSARAHEKKLLPEEFSGATFTVSNLGMYGIEEFSAIINPPEGAILAVGAIIEKPVAEYGNVVIGHRMKITLSCDHRVIDGAVGAQFMQNLKTILENPAALAL